MSSLYEITKNLLDCDWFDEETGEVDLDKKKQFDELKISFDEKAENIIKYIKNLNSDAEQIKAEERSLKDRREAKERKAESLKGYLEAMMRLSGRDKLEYTCGEAKFRKSAPVELDANFIEWAKQNAQDLLSFKEPTPNKIAIKEAIKAGMAVEGARIVENISLQVK